MLNAPTAKTLLEYDPSIIPVIFECEDYFEIAIGSSKIAPQRMTSPPQARQFKTLAAAHSYLRKFLEYEGDITIHIAP
jgi:hypothetical protein